MKQFIAALLIVASSGASAWSQAGKPSSAAELATYVAADREKVLYEGAKKEGKLVWYTTLATDQNKTISSIFEKKHPGVAVDTYRTGSSALAQRLRTEAKARAIPPTPLRRLPAA